MSDIDELLKRLTWQSKIVRRLVQHGINSNHPQAKHDGGKVDVDSFFDGIIQLQSALAAERKRADEAWNEGAKAFRDFAVDELLNRANEPFVGDPELQSQSFKHHEARQSVNAEIAILLAGMLNRVRSLTRKSEKP